MAPAGRGSLVALAAALACAAAPVARAEAVFAAAFANAGSTPPFQITTGPDYPTVLAAGGASAWGFFNDTIDITGWAFLEVHSNGSLPDLAQVQAAGFLEGALTADRSWMHLQNSQGGVTGWSPALTSFVHENQAWMVQQVGVHADKEPFWHHVGLVLAQQQYAYLGYSAVAQPSQALSADVYYTSTYGGDMDDACTVFGCALTRSVRAKRAAAAVRGAGAASREVSLSALAARGEYLYEPQTDGHCSALVKPVRNATDGSWSDVIMGHTTWGSLETMTRIFKHYDLPLTMGGVYAQYPAPGRHMTFSSYPACIASSDDDYYQLSPSNLLVLETTIINNNASLWQFVTPQTLPYWVRNAVANRLANTGQEWMEMFGQHNSGTYNNEWSVLDFKRFKPGMKGQLPEGLLWVGDQMPGYWEYTDHTPVLNELGYWASYNRPSFPSIFEVSNQTALVAAFGDHFSWTNTSRAQIFRRLQSGINDTFSFAAVLRHNQFQSDPEGTQACTGGHRSGSNAISERGDLTPPADAAGGCIIDISQQDEAGIDCKVSSYGLFMGGGLSTLIQGGPTHDSQPPFVWSTSPFASIPHAGLPDAWDFDWLTVTWDLSA